VKQLSFGEKEELENAEASLKKYREGKLRPFSNVDEMIDSLSR
jgi:hypothetical protein